MTLNERIAAVLAAAVYPCLMLCLIRLMHVIPAMQCKSNTCMSHVSPALYQRGAEFSCRPCRPTIDSYDDDECSCAIPFVRVYCFIRVMMSDCGRETKLMSKRQGEVGVDNSRSNRNRNSSDNRAEGNGKW